MPENWKNAAAQGHSPEDRPPPQLSTFAAQYSPHTHTHHPRIPTLLQLEAFYLINQLADYPALMQIRGTNSWEEAIPVP